MAKVKCILNSQDGERESLLINELQLTDISTGKIYRLVVESAILKLEEVEDG